MINFMKKQVVFIAFCCAFSTGNAQTFPNGGFENWTNQGIYEDPSYWSGLNLMSMFGAELTALKSTDSHSGTYALKLVSSISDIGNDGTVDTIPGMLMLGTTDLINGTGTAGHPFSHRPDSLVGWYKLVSPDNSPFVFEFSSTKWDANSNMQETIGVAHFEGQPSASYIRFSIPINYSSGALPDSIMAYIGTSMDGSATNEVYLDDLSFVYNSTASIDEQGIQAQIFPNPVSDHLTIQSDIPVERIVVKDLQGKQVVVQWGNSTTVQLETNHFSQGVYVCEVYLSNGTSQHMKFIKK